MEESYFYHKSDRVLQKVCRGAGAISLWRKGPSMPEHILLRRGNERHGYGVAGP